MLARLGTVGGSALVLLSLLAACDGGSATTGSGGSGGETGGTGGIPECVEPADCVPAVPDCQSLVGCIDGKCAFEDAPEGKPLSTQALGDCVQTVCDGQGSTKVVEANDDVPTDGSDCTEHTCEGGMPVKTILPSIPCYTGPAGTEDVGACKGGDDDVQRHGSAGGRV